MFFCCILVNVVSNYLLLSFFLTGCTVWSVWVFVLIYGWRQFDIHSNLFHLPCGWQLFSIFQHFCWMVKTFPLIILSLLCTEIIFLDVYFNFCLVFCGVEDVFTVASVIGCVIPLQWLWLYIIPCSGFVFSWNLISWSLEITPTARLSYSYSLLLYYTK